MRTVEGKSNTHYISSEEWDAGYMTGKPIIQKLNEGDIVIINRGSHSTAYEVIISKSLKPI